jgi:hypothetical protein
LSFSRQFRRNLGLFPTRFNLSRWEKKIEKDRQKIFREMKKKKVIIIKDINKEEDGEYKEDENEKGEDNSDSSLKEFLVTDAAMA